MTASSGPSRAEARLLPCPWRLVEPPPLPPLRWAPLPEPRQPLVLCLDRREPLPEGVREALAGSLSPREQQRRAALRQPADQERFLRGRGALRQLLAAWLGRAPAAVPIEVGPHGKPRCPAGPEFNVSHSGELILLALHPSRPVGVDVEQARPDLDWRPIAQRVLPPAEAGALERIAAREGAGAAADGFLAAWCRLEARLKARGDGLPGLGDPRQRQEADAAEVTLWDVAVPPGYRAAVALMDRPAVAAAGCPPDPPG